MSSSFKLISGSTPYQVQIKYQTGDYKQPSRSTTNWHSKAY
ncbi:hypothetical protein [Nostoc sp.]